MADFIERIGTVAEEENDNKKADYLWDRVPKCYQSQMLVRLPYSHYGTFIQSFGTLEAVNQYKVNSIYDFDLTNIGHQPLGRDTWASIYNYYKVLETRIHVELTWLDYKVDGATGSANYPILSGGMMDIAASPPGGATNWMEAALSGHVNKTVQFTPVTSINQIGSRGNATHSYSMVWKESMFDTATIAPDKDTWTAVGSDPDFLNYFSALVYNPASAASHNLVFRITGEFLVAFKQVNQTLLYTQN